MSKLISDTIWQVRRASQNGNVVVITKTCTLPAPTHGIRTVDNVLIPKSISPIPAAPSHSIAAVSALKSPLLGTPAVYMESEQGKTIAIVVPAAVATGTQHNPDATNSPSVTATPNLSAI